MKSVKPWWLDVIIRQLLANNFGGRGIESRRQLFCRANDLDARNKQIWKRNENKKKRACERPLTRERAHSKTKRTRSQASKREQETRFKGCGVWIERERKRERTHET